jgi:hypothetical protein
MLNAAQLGFSLEEVQGAFALVDPNVTPDDEPLPDFLNEWYAPGQISLTRFQTHGLTDWRPSPAFESTFQVFGKMESGLISLLEKQGDREHVVDITGRLWGQISAETDVTQFVQVQGERPVTFHMKGTAHGPYRLRGRLVVKDKSLRTWTCINLVPITPPPTPFEEVETEPPIGAQPTGAQPTGAEQQKQQQALAADLAAQLALVGAGGHGVGGGALTPRTGSVQAYGTNYLPDPSGSSGQPSGGAAASTYAAHDRSIDDLVASLGGAGGSGGDAAGAQHERARQQAELAMSASQDQVVFNMGELDALFMNSDTDTDAMLGAGGAGDTDDLSVPLEQLLELVNGPNPRHNE